MYGTNNIHDPIRNIYIHFSIDNIIKVIGKKSINIYNFVNNFAIITYIIDIIIGFINNTIHILIYYNIIICNCSITILFIWFTSINCSDYNVSIVTNIINNIFINN